MNHAKKLIAFASLVASAFVLTGCGKTNIQPETVQPVSATMAAHPLTPEAIGQKRVTKDLSGNITTFEVVSAENSLTRTVSDDGHEYTNLPNIILPSPSFSGAKWGEGKQSISSVKGELFPLTVGNKMSFMVNGESTKWPDGWKNKRVCEVESQERITVVAGEYDAFRIVCDEKQRKRVMYFSPEINTLVWYKNVHKTDPSKTTGWEMVEFLAG